MNVNKSEENIWKLCERLLTEQTRTKEANEELNEFHVVFISNPNRTVKIILFYHLCFISYFGVFIRQDTSVVSEEM